MALSDLGGLGETEGVPFLCDWSPPNPLPRLIPWLGVFALLALVSNRRVGAWWIWVPLVVLTAGETAVAPLLEFVPSQVVTPLLLAFNSLAFGLAALWLLSARLGHRLRFVVFLEIAAVVAGGSGLAYLVRADWSSAEEAFGFLVVLGVCVLVTSVGLSLAAWVCRRRYRPIALSLWLGVFLALLWALVVCPFFLVAAMAGGGGDLAEFISGMAHFVALNLVVVLAFLVLAFANGVFRERLTALLHLGPGAPPLLAAAPAPGAEPAPAPESP